MANIKKATKSPDELLAPLRDQITSTDREIIRLLGHRHRLVLQVGEVKRKNGLQVRDTVREQKLLDILVSAGKMDGLSKNYVENLYRIVIENSVAHEEELIK